MAPRKAKPKNYDQIIEKIFFKHYKEGDVEVAWDRDEIGTAAAELGIPAPKNFGDVPYSFRYRAALPDSIKSKAPEGATWVIRSVGRSRYKFVASVIQEIVPNPLLTVTKVPDSTPGLVAKYSKGDEQALLVRLRYNRLLDVFTGVTCYSLQNHLRTTVEDMGQVETDEIYVGVDRRGAHYVFPVQAKGGKDRQNVVQIEQDLAVCAEKFPKLIARAIAAQFMTDDVIALFAFEDTEEGVRIAAESHYKLVPHAEITDEELASYRERLPNG
jgi:hypothetical protein